MVDEVAADAQNRKQRTQKLCTMKIQCQALASISSAVNYDHCVQNI